MRCWVKNRYVHALVGKLVKERDQVTGADERKGRVCEVKMRG